MGLAPLRHPSTVSATFILLVLALWAAALVAVMRWQVRLIFGMPRARRWAPPGPHAGHVTECVTLAMPDGARLAGWLCLAPQPPAGIVVWLGGRNEDVAWTAAIGSWLGPRWTACAFNYRGRAGSTGRATEANSVDDAAAIVAWAAARAGLPQDRVVLAGRSLGGAIATQVAAMQRPAGLLLLSPPASVRRIVMRNPLLLPGLPWLRHPFDALAVASTVACPGLVLLAQRDRRVPHRESRLLARALRCRVQTIPGTDHRSLARCEASLAAMAAFLTGLPACEVGDTP